jgi:hypothetical protein
MSNPIHLAALLGIIVLWLLPTILTARLAERKGRSFAVYLVVSLLIGWPIPLIAALILRPRKAATTSPPRPEPRS